MEQYVLTREISPSISFPESHDTARLCDELGGNINGLKQRYLFSSCFRRRNDADRFEFAFRRKLHVVKTRPEDWEDTGFDLTPFITSVNRVKSEHAVFQEEAPTEILHNDNPNILLMWKASACTREESLLILNKDIYNKNISMRKTRRNIFRLGRPVDVSPEYALDYIPAPFSYDLRPDRVLYWSLQGMHLLKIELSIELLILVNCFIHIQQILPRLHYPGHGITGLCHIYPDIVNSHVGNRFNRFGNLILNLGSIGQHIIQHFTKGS